MSTLAQASTQFGNDVLNGIPRSTDGSNHANEQYYQDLRSKAREAKDKAANLSKESQEAYSRGDKAAAGELSQQAKKLRADADRMNGDAATWVFRENNTDSGPDEIDLHGLFVNEAITALDARIAVCQQHQQPILKAIVGKGIHSETHVAKLRPAVMDHCKERGLQSEVDEKNPGVVVVHISEGQQPPQQQQQQQGYQQPQQGYQQPQQGQPQQGYQQNYQQQQQKPEEPLGCNLHSLFRVLMGCLSN